MIHIRCTVNRKRNWEGGGGWRRGQWASWHQSLLGQLRNSQASVYPNNLIHITSTFHYLFGIRVTSMTPFHPEEFVKLGRREIMEHLQHQFHASEQKWSWSRAILEQPKFNDIVKTWMNCTLTIVPKTIFVICVNCNLWSHYWTGIWKKCLCYKLPKLLLNLSIVSNY